MGIDILKMISRLPKDQIDKVKNLLGLPVIQRKRVLLCRGIRCKFWNIEDDKLIGNGNMVKCRFNNQIVDTLKDKCPASQSGKFDKYGFYCNGCNERLGTTYAEKSPEKERIDFHYDQPVRNKLGKPVKGCACPSITQDNELAFECYCGNDTRDFRGHQRHEHKEKETSQGREWNKKTSKFRAIKEK